jgi:hypothetical protein
MAANVPTRPTLLAAATVGLLVAGLAASLPAHAAPAPGKWTKVTSPRDGAVVVRQQGHEGHWTIKGRASSGVSEVNVYCLRGTGTTVDATTVATAVTVSSGAFSATVPVPGGVDLPQCRLRALPDGVSTQAAYLGSYAGPVVDLDSWHRSATDYQLTAAAGSGMVSAGSIGSCATETMLSLSPEQEPRGPSEACLLSLSQNAAGTASSVRVDGHDAYPAAEAAQLGLSPSSPLQLRVRLAHRRLHWVDVESLDRCSSQVAFPPPGSCSLEPTGVEVRQEATVVHGGLQVRLRTEFRSVDGHRHSLRLAFANKVLPTASGDLGVRFPGQSAFHVAAAGHTTTRLGHGAGTMLARTNVHGDDGDPAVATRALTWSRPPSRVSFASGDATAYELDYRLTVPKGGSVRLGFADSSSVRTAATRVLGRRAAADMMPAPRITSPRPGSAATGTKTKVAGVVRLGANGLPTSVKVNGHRARLKPNRSGSKATFKVTLTEAAGKHTLTAVARDAAGNTRSVSVVIRTT